METKRLVTKNVFVLDLVGKAGRDSYDMAPNILSTLLVFYLV